MGPQFNYNFNQSVNPPQINPAEIATTKTENSKTNISNQFNRFENRLIIRKNANIEKNTNNTHIVIIIYCSI